MVLPQQTTALATTDCSSSFFTTHFAKHITSCTCSFVLIFLFNLWLMLACSWHAVMVTYFTMSASPPSKNTGHTGVHFNHYLSGFIFRSRWFLQGYSIISSPRSLYSSSIQPLQNNQSRWRDWELYWESEMYKVNMNGDSRVPCGAPVLHISKSDRALAHLTYCGLSVR